MKNRITIVTKRIIEGRTGYSEAIINAIARLEGKRAKIIIEEYKRPRSDAQNRYYWGVVLKSYARYFQSLPLDISNDDLHLWIKEYVWGDWVDINVNGLPFRKILTSTLLDVQEWEYRMTLSRAYAANHFGLQIPEPSEKIDQHVLNWLEHPDGLYYEADYKNYFDIQS